MHRVARRRTHRGDVRAGGRVVVHVPGGARAGALVLVVALALPLPLGAALLRRVALRNTLALYTTTPHTKHNYSIVVALFLSEQQSEAMHLS